MIKKYIQYIDREREREREKERERERARASERESERLFLRSLKNSSSYYNSNSKSTQNTALQALV